MDHLTMGGSMSTATFRIAALATFLLGAAPVSAQDWNFHLPIDQIELRMRSDSLRITGWRGSRMENDRTQRVTLEHDDGTVIAVKWANAPRGGSTYNNEPRFEAAAYEFQKLFLDPEFYVVPPVVLRAYPIDVVQSYAPSVRPTFDKAPGSVLVALQYWMNGVTPQDFWSEERFRADSVYARRFANFNIFTHLIRHVDANAGNYLISVDSTHPRVFSVDNGVAFSSQVSNRGDSWRFLRLDSLPRSTTDRLAAVTLEQLEQALGVLAEFEIRDGRLIPVERGPNLKPGSGVRVTEDRVQIGLTSREIRDLDNRVRRLVRDAAEGKYRLF